jgi:hypothetical protein
MMLLMEIMGQRGNEWLVRLDMTGAGWRTMSPGTIVVLLLVWSGASERALSTIYLLRSLIRDLRYLGVYYGLEAV